MAGDLLYSLFRAPHPSPPGVCCILHCACCKLLAEAGSAVILSGVS